LGSSQTSGGITGTGGRTTLISEIVAAPG